MEEVKAKRSTYNDQVEDLMFKIFDITNKHVDGMKNLDKKYKIYVALDAILDSYLFIIASGPMGVNARQYMNDYVDEVTGRDGKEKVN